MKDRNTLAGAPCGLSLTRPPVLLQSEYVAERDERLRFMSGFSGSHGVAVVTDSKAALWTDGRYLLQADNELGCDWLLMGRGEVHVSTLTQPPIPTATQLITEREIVYRTLELSRLWFLFLKCS